MRTALSPRWGSAVIYWTQGLRPGLHSAAASRLKASAFVPPLSPDADPAIAIGSLFPRQKARWVGGSRSRVWLVQETPVSTLVLQKLVKPLSCYFLA